MINGGGGGGGRESHRVLERNRPLQSLSGGKSPEGCLGTHTHTSACGPDPANLPPLCGQLPGAGEARPGERSLLGRVRTPGAGPA